jgi:hypothetical protein
MFGVDLATEHSGLGTDSAIDSGLAEPFIARTLFREGEDPSRYPS